MQVQYPITFDYIKALSGELLRPKLIPFSGWNMDTNPDYNLPHGLGGMPLKLRAIQVMIFDNSGSSIMPLVGVASGGAGSYEGGITAFGVTNIGLTRRTGGTFDAVAFNAATGIALVWLAD